MGGIIRKSSKRNSILSPYLMEEVSGGRNSLLVCLLVILNTPFLFPVDKDLLALKAQGEPDILGKRGVSGCGAEVFGRAKFLHHFFHFIVFLFFFQRTKLQNILIAELLIAGHPAVGAGNVKIRFAFLGILDDLGNSTYNGAYNPQYIRENISIFVSSLYFLKEYKRRFVKI